MYEYPFGGCQQLNLNWIINEIITLHKQLDPDYELPNFDNAFPYMNLNQLNLDWILRELKAIKDLAPTEDARLLKMVANALIANTYDTTTQYKVDDIVYRDDEKRLYKCIATTPAGGEPFDSTKWLEIDVGEVLTDLLVNRASTSDDISNESGVAGATVTDALNTLNNGVSGLNDEINQISTTFDFYNPNAVYRIANNQGVAREGYTFNADNSITVNKDYSGYGSSYAFNDSLLLTAGLYTVTAYVETSNLNPLLSSAVRVKLGLSSAAGQYPTLTTTRDGNTPISQGDNAGWLTATFEITEEETFCFLIMPNSAAWNPLTISNLSIIGATAYDAKARTEIVNLNGAITSNPNIKFRSVGNSIMTGSVWVNGAADHMTGYNDSPYGIIAASLGIKQANVTHTMLSGSGMCSDAGNGTFYDYIVTNQLSLAGMDYLMTMLWTGDMYTLPIGTVNDTSASNTIAGKAIGVCNYLRSNYPSVKLILLGVPPTNWAIKGDSVFTGAYSNGYNIIQCDALMHSLAEKYHFTFIDWEQLFFATYFQLFTDGDNVHPNADKVYRLMGEYLADNVKGQVSANDAFLKTLVLQSDTITGSYAGWRNIFTNDNPLIDESMTVVAIDAAAAKEVKTVTVAWKVVKGNVQVYGNFSDTGTSLYITLARTNKNGNAGVYHVASFTSASLITDTTISTSGEQTVNTYNSRKLSDYSLLYFALGSAAKTVYATAFLPTVVFTQSGYVLNLSGLAGANYDVASSAIIKYDSDTSVKVTLTGSKAFTHFQVTGTRIE